MDREDIIRMAREAGFKVDWQHADVAEIKAKRYEYFASLVAAAEREKVARWHIGSGYTTGHGDTIEDLLVELEWQVRESEREACCSGEVLNAANINGGDHPHQVIEKYQAAIRARGNT